MLGQAWAISRVNLKNLFRNASRKSVKVVTQDVFIVTQLALLAVTQTNKQTFLDIIL
jgi:hypothetical protein